MGGYWLDILPPFACYAVVLAVIARGLKMGHVQGIVYGSSLLAAWLARDVARTILPVLPAGACIAAAFGGFVVANVIIEVGLK